MTTLALRDYQHEAIEAVETAWARGVRRPAVVAPTGSGKTVTFAELARRAGKALILVHRDELVTQTVAKVRAVAGIEAGVVKAERDDVGADVMVASVQTLAREHRRLRVPVAGDDAITIVDECFPAGTMIGNQPIESLRPGDVVPSYDEACGDVVQRSVVAMMRRVPTSMVRVRLADGRSFECTPNHPLMTVGGWCPARLSRGAYVLSFTHDATAQGTDRANMRRVRCDIHGASQVEDQCNVQVGPRLLSGLMPRLLGQSRRLGPDGTDQSQICLTADEGEQPDASRGVTRSDEGDASKNWTSAARPRWQRQSHSRAATTTRRFLRLAHRSNCGADGRQAAVSLQAGYCTSDDEGLHRGGRGVPRFAGAPRVGHAPGRTAVLTRVADVQVLQPGRDGTYGGVCRDGAVYNIEVEGTHTYLIGDGLVVHNCHHATATTYRAVLDHRGGRAVGFTATMARGDGGRLGDVWSEIVYRRGVIDMIRAGWLADVEGYRLDVPDLDLSGVTMRGGDFSEGELGSALESSVAPETVAACYVERYPQMPAILFAPTVDTAQLFAAVMTATGVRAAAVWGAQPLDERRRTLRAFERGELDVLCNCMVLTEGFDSPRAQLAIIARPTASAPLFVQMVGRVLRPYPGKTKAVVLDVVGTTGRHELATLATLGGLTKDVEAGQTLLAAWDEQAQGKDAERERRYREGRGEMSAVDLFGGSRRRWLRTHAGWWFLPGVDRYITIQPSPDSDGVELWDVASWNKGKGGSWLARAVPGVELAMSLGEADVKPEEQVLAEKERAWRKKRASEKQLAFLASLAGADVAESMIGHRSGEVGDLLSVELASRRIDPGLRRYLT